MLSWWPLMSYTINCKKATESSEKNIGGYKLTKHAYQQETTELMKDLNTTSEGLNPKEAQQRLQENGPNQLKEAKKKSSLTLFLETFKDAMVIDHDIQAGIVLPIQTLRRISQVTENPDAIR